VWPTAFNNPINNSLRFRASASAYLNRTQGTPTTATKWTYSYWVKRGIIGGSSVQTMISGTGGGGSGIVFYNDKLWASSYSGSYQWNFLSAAVYRDPSAWYHIMVAYDSTQATDTNRVKIYVNGVQLTAFSTDVGAITYPTQNTVGQVGGVSGSVRIGLRDDSFYYFDGYLAEMYFVDGVQLTPSSFGTTDAYGIWQPIPYTGAYGTNGFYLPFTDNSALTTSSNVGLGKDFSGNGNYWTTNGISITTGSTYDSMKDVPTNTNSNTANYCTWNPLDKSGTSYIPTISNGNLSFAAGSAGQFSPCRGTQFVSSGKWYFEVTITNNGTYSGQVGVANNYNIYQSGGDNSVSSSGGVGAAWDGRGFLYYTGNSVAFTPTFTTNDVISCAFDADTGKTWFRKNVGSWYDSSGGTTGDPATGANPVYTYTAGTSVAPFANGVSPHTQDANFGQRPFAYTAPTGFYPLNTYNIPTPTILDGDQYMDATLYTGNSSTQTVANSGSMQPDFVWIKDRSAVSQHVLTDSVRGVDRQLFSSLTNAEQTSATAITSFNSNGFTTGANPSPTGATNSSPDAFVAWQWRASNAAGVSNTQGTITSTVSANTTAGFSIATFTSPSSGTASFGHGLGVTPSFVIVKSRASGNWICQHISTGTQYLLLNGTGAATTDSIVWNSAFTSTVVNIGTGFAGTVNYVAYCFAQVAGYSAFGSYTGNGDPNGTFVYLGFRPKFVLIKSTASGTNWVLHDSSREPFNEMGTNSIGYALNPENNVAEITNANLWAIDFTSNGFKNRSSSASVNSSAQTYIYMAFAENPFKISRAR
jgi:hypothetical protein